MERVWEHSRIKPLRIRHAPWSSFWLQGWSGLCNQGGCPMFHQAVDTGLREHSDGNCPGRGAGSWPQTCSFPSANRAYKQRRKVWPYNDAAVTTLSKVIWCYKPPHLFHSPKFYFPGSTLRKYFGHSFIYSLFCPLDHNKLHETRYLAYAIFC